MNEITVKYNQKKEYEVVTANDFSGLPDKFNALFPDAGKVLIVTDRNVGPFYLKEITKLLKNYKVFSVTLDAGEASKSLAGLEQVINVLLENEFSRNDVAVALGGGVMGDLTGFAASIYKRGIPFVLLPTTLLSMVDSSIGGKTAIDYKSYKNMIGAFHMPSLVYGAVHTLSTLPEREFYAGFAEIMKAGLLADEKYYIWLIDHIYEISEKEPEAMEYMIGGAIEIKRAIIEKDPLEKGDRALLNLGHTIGHAIESHFAGEYLHGECVALGCVAAAYISWKKDMIPMEEYYEIRDMFVPFNLPISIVVSDIEPIVKLLHNDKKNTAGSVNMVLLKKVGKAVLVKGIEEELIREAIEELNFKEED